MFTGALRRSLPKGGENMLKIYKMPNGHEYQYEEGQQPAGAVEVKPETEKKAAEPLANKAVKPANKKRKAEKK